ncbi:MAG: site-specific integrase [Candidatus Acidoferrales bacterium]
MSVYKRGCVYWYRFRFAGQVIRESSKSTSRTVARAAEDLLRGKAAHLAPRTVAIERANLKHLNPYFGKMLVCDIRAEDIAHYQARRQEEGAAAATINLEVATVRAILRKNRLWATLQPDVRMLREREDVGRAVSHEEEGRLLEACRTSRSRSLYPAAVLALNTCMCYSELRLLRWQQVDFAGRTLKVGQSKTESGAGRVIPLNDRALAVLGFWASLFPDRQPEEYVFPSERYGAAGNAFSPCAYATDPSRPIGRWKEAWEAAKTRSGVRCRFHDLRHTGCTRMLEAGVPFSVVAAIMGWSASTTVRMAKRYGHIGQAAQRHAVSVLDGATSGTGRLPASGVAEYPQLIS